LLTCAIQCKRHSGFDRIHNHTSLFLLLRSWCYLGIFTFIYFFFLKHILL
jgi:hypothetical protein